MTYDQEAQALLTGQPDCQHWGSLHEAPTCEPGCVHEQLMTARATVYAMLERNSYLDAIAARLDAIVGELENLAIIIDTQPPSRKWWRRR